MIYTVGFLTLAAVIYSRCELAGHTLVFWLPFSLGRLLFTTRGGFRPDTDRRFAIVHIRKGNVQRIMGW